ncbi:MAG: flagellar biosynthetic protein FliO [Epsilonproteobacteria bacterium]|nr:flagellar biosynthetic protein FliO [Campylobacterota bacterium]
MLSSAEIIKLVAVFVIIVVALYTFYYYLTKVGIKLGGRWIKILESRAIGKDRYLILTYVEDTLFLLASDENGIKVLKEWEKEDPSKDKVV